MFAPGRRNWIMLASNSFEAVVLRYELLGRLTAALTSALLNTALDSLALRYRLTIPID